MEQVIKRPAMDDNPQKEFNPTKTSTIQNQPNSRVVNKSQTSQKTNQQEEKKLLQQLQKQRQQNVVENRPKSLRQHRQTTNHNTHS